MKIVYDYRIFSKQRHGGISRYFVELAKWVNAIAGAEAKILAPLYVSHYLKGGGDEVSAGLYLKKSPKFAQSLIEGVNVALSKGKLLISPPDILHETYYGAQGLVGKQVKTVTTVYDLIHAKFPELYPNDETPRLQAEAVARADHVFCISKKTQEDLIEMLGVPESKTSVTHLGCDFHLKKKDVQPNPLSFPYFLFVGPRGKHKNFQVLLDAYASSERLKKDFKIVCFGSTSFTSEELSQQRKLGIGPDQVLHVTGEDSLLPTYYTYAEAFVYPSLYEGFGLPPLEAMSLGCPTICSNAGSIPEILGDSTLYFSPTDFEALKSALESVAYSPEKKRELSQAGLQKSASYTWEKCAEVTYLEYRNLLGK